MTPQSHRVSANGLDHHVLVWEGARVSATCVLIHGYMDAAGTWDLVAPSLAEAGLRVVAPDMRGFGDGPRVASGGYYHFPDYVADLAALLDTLAPDRMPLHLVGHSMGGTIVTLFTGANPSRPKSIAILEGLGPPDMPPDLGPHRMVKWLDDLRGLRERPVRATFPRDEALRRLAVNHPGIAQEILATRLPHLIRDAGNGAVTWRFDPLHKTTSPMPFFAAMLRAFARRVACPTLFVSGGPAGYHPPDEDERLASFARLRRETIADAGHMMHWSRPRDVAHLLVDFFAASGETAPAEGGPDRV
jgi:pimeloyl-ACP methyl ester carboxylesterase